MNTEKEGGNISADDGCRSDAKRSKLRAAFLLSVPILALGATAFVFVSTHEFHAKLNTFGLWAAEDCSEPSGICNVMLGNNIIVVDDKPVFPAIRHGDSQRFSYSDGEGTQLYKLELTDHSTLRLHGGGHSVTLTKKSL